VIAAKAHTESGHSSVVPSFESERTYMSGFQFEVDK
jgi:hypothetical protein